MFPHKECKISSSRHPKQTLIQKKTPPFSLNENEGAFSVLGYLRRCVFT